MSEVPSVTGPSPKLPKHRLSAMIYDLVLFPFRTVEREAVAAQLSCNSIHSTPNRSMRERTRGEAAESAQAMGLDVHRRSARGF
jgi:hypothetical protein